MSHRHPAITKHHIVDARRVLRHIGVEFALDIDNCLQIEWPTQLDTARLVELVEWARDDLEVAMRNEAECARACLVGGPLNGEPSYFLFPKRIFHPDHRHGMTVYYRRLDHARWVMYHIQTDRRGFFLGEFTSERKCRRAFVPPEK